MLTKDKAIEWIQEEATYEDLVRKRRHGQSHEIFFQDSDVWTALVDAIKFHEYALTHEEKVMTSKKVGWAI